MNNNVIKKGLKGAIISSYICKECGTRHTFNELKQAYNDVDYSYYCKKCGDVIESNGVYYGK